MDIMEHYFYTKEHEWINIEDDIGIMGVTDYAQDALGDITYVELPSVGAEVEQFEQIASIESVKAASDIYAPMTGKVMEVNTDLESDPGLINKSCFDKGWIVKLELSASEEKSKLMNAEEYKNFVATLD